MHNATVEGQGANPGHGGGAAAFQDRGIPFTKAQALGNDFLIVEAAALRRAGMNEDSYGGFSIGICDRHFGVGADGLEILLEDTADEGADRVIRIFNSDGSEAEISGNGTRCVAAVLAAAGAAAESLRIGTRAGVKVLRMLGRDGRRFQWEMSMGRPRFEEGGVGGVIETQLGRRAVTIVDVGNPQCVFLVDDFDWDWRAWGREIENHPRFPDRTNVSFVKPVDRHAIEVRFWERGVGETASSGTGSTGAAIAAILAGRCGSPLRAASAAGDLEIRWEHERDEVVLSGPAEIVFRGEYWAAETGR